jgi:hypothetical protein
MIRRISGSHSVTKLISQGQCFNCMQKTPAISIFTDFRRHYRVTRRNDSELIVGGIGLFVVAAGAQYALTGYNSYAGVVRDTSVTVFRVRVIGSNGDNYG